MALYTEKALLNLIHKNHGTKLRPEGYTGLYYEDPCRKNQRRYIVIGKQLGGPRLMSDRQERQISRKKTWWPEEKKVEAATLHVATGNMVRVAELTKVPIQTLRRWCEEDWWASTQQRVKREAIDETDAKFTKLIDKAIKKLEQAVEHGDYLYDIKKGQLVRVPMTGRDLSIVAGTTFDKRQLLRGEATRITKTSDPEKHLEELAKRFAAMVGGPRNRVLEGEITDAEIINEVADEGDEQGKDGINNGPRLVDDGQLPAGTVPQEKDAGDAGSAEITASATDADDALPAETPGSEGNQRLPDGSVSAQVNYPNV